MEALFATNKYVTDTEPWHLPQGDVRRSVLVRTVLEVLYIYNPNPNPNPRDPNPNPNPNPNPTLTLTLTRLASRRV